MDNSEIEIRADDERIKHVPFKTYRSTNLRRAIRYSPQGDEPEAIALQTPWGEQLTCQKGDYIVSEVGDSPDRWPVAADIFEKTYIEVQPGYYMKRATVLLAPLIDLTDGNPDTPVTIHTDEGSVRVRSGDFYLARGIHGEIWPIPQEKVSRTMIEVDEPSEDE
jgi:hypothetical protein